MHMGKGGFKRGLTALGLATVNMRLSKRNRDRNQDYSRHAHGEKMDRNIIIKRFENMPAYGRVVNTRVPVALEIRQMMLANIYHLCSKWGGSQVFLDFWNKKGYSE